MPPSQPHLKKTKAFSYLRVSGVGQVAGDGFPRQRAAIAAFAKASGFTVVEEFREPGVSGTRELADRPALAALLDRIESNGVRVVIVERADRLARDLLISEVLCAEFRKREVRVLDASGNELTADDGDPTRVLIRQVLGAVSQFEKSVLVLKLKASRDRMRRTTGRCEGRLPFGHHLAERPILDWMRAMRRKRVNGRPQPYAAIAAALNAQGTPSRMGKPWSTSSVFQILGRRAKRAPRPPKGPRRENPDEKITRVSGGSVDVRENLTGCVSLELTGATSPLQRSSHAPSLPPSDGSDRGTLGRPALTRANFDPLLTDG